MSFWVTGGSGGGGAPSGAAGGDLSGTYPNPTVAKVNGVAAASYYVVGGTDVPITDGGTGQSTAVLARGASGLNIESVTTFSNANVTVAATDRTVMQTGTLSASRTATLPAASAVPAGYWIVVGDASGSVTTTNTIVITRAGSDTINGATTAVIGSPYGARRLVSDGTSTWSFDGGVLRASLNLSDVQSASTSRTNLGLGTIATQAASAVAITGGTVTGITDVTVADGGTGASDAATARTNLGLGTAATLASSAVLQTANNLSEVTPLTARTNLGFVAREAVIGPTGTIAATFDRTAATVAATTFTSGTLYLYLIGLRKGDVITNLNFKTTSVAGASMTHFWGGLWDSSRVSLRLTADDTTATWNATTVRTEALTSTYTVPTTGAYYVGFVATATGTVPGMWAVSLGANISNIAPNVSVTADTGQTTPVAEGVTAASPTVIGPHTYIWLT